MYWSYAERELFVCSVITSFSENLRPHIYTQNTIQFIHQHYPGMNTNKKRFCAHHALFVIFWTERSTNNSTASNSGSFKKFFFVFIHSFTMASTLCASLLEWLNFVFDFLLITTFTYSTQLYCRYKVSSIWCGACSLSSGPATS